MKDVQMVEKNALLESVMQGRLGFFRSCSVYSPLPGAAFDESENGSFYYSSGIDYAPCNGVIGDSGIIPSEEEIEKALKYFNSRKVPFIWWTAAQNLENHGFQFGGILTGIAIDIAKGIPTVKTGSQVQVKIISSEEDLRAFATLAVNAFGMNPKALGQFQAINTAAMNHQEQIHFLALLDGIPIGTATLSTCEDSAGIWNLATLPEYRKHGVGTALVSAALLEAKKLQYDYVMAILMPKGMAWGLFTKMGFKEVCQFPFYVYGVSTDELEK